MQTVAGTVLPGNEGLVASTAERTIANLSQLSQLKPLIPCGVSTDVRLLVEQGKEPHLYTRDTLERTSGENQLANGKFQAISSYTQLLAGQIQEDGSVGGGDQGATCGIAELTTRTDEGKGSVNMSGGFGVEDDKKGKGKKWVLLLSLIPSQAQSLTVDLVMVLCRPPARQTYSQSSHQRKRDRP